MFSVVIPWRGTGQIERTNSCCWTMERWEALFPEAQVIYADSRDEPFSRGRSRNIGVADAEYDTIILADSDTVPMREPILEAVGIVANGGWAICYDEGRYYNLSQTASEMILALEPGADVPEPVEGDWEHKLTSWAGMLAVPRTLFDEHGYDERFIGWGWEDNAFQIATDRCLGKHRRASGFVVHLWHPVTDGGFDTQHELANRRLFQEEYVNRYGWKDPRHLE